MADPTYSTVKQKLDDLEIQLGEIDELLKSDPENRDLIGLKKELQFNIDISDKALNSIPVPTDYPERVRRADRVLGTIGATFRTTNALHDKTSELSEKTDSLHEKTDELHEKTDSLHSKIDTLHEKADSGLEGSLRGSSMILDRVYDVQGVITSLGMQATEIAEKLDHVGDAVVGELGSKVDSLSSQMASIEEKLSKVDGLGGKIAQLQQAVGIQHLMMVDTNGPIHGFSKLRDQVTEIQKSTSMLEMESDGLHASMKDHVTKSVSRLILRLADVDDTVRFLSEKAEQSEGLGNRMARLEHKFDSFAGIEKKLDSLLVLGTKLDRLASLHDKLDSFAKLHKKTYDIESRLDKRSDDEVECGDDWDSQADFGSSQPVSIASQCTDMNTWQSYNAFRAAQHSPSPSVLSNRSFFDSTSAKPDGVESPCWETSGWDLHSNPENAQEQGDEVEAAGSNDWVNSRGETASGEWKTYSVCNMDPLETAAASNSDWGDAQQQENNSWEKSAEATSNWDVQDTSYIYEDWMGYDAADPGPQLTSDAEYQMNTDPSMMPLAPVQELDGSKIQADGTIRGCGGNVIGLLVEGDADRCAGEDCRVDDGGNALDRYLPLLSVLDNLKVEKDGKVLNPLTGAVLAQVVKCSEGDSFDSEPGYHYCNAKGKVMDRGCETDWKVQTVSQELGAPEQGSAEVERHGLDEHDIKIIMGMTGFNRELVAMMLAEPETEAAKKLTAMLGPEDAERAFW